MRTAIAISTIVFYSNNTFSNSNNSDNSNDSTSRNAQHNNNRSWDSNKVVAMVHHAAAGTRDVNYHPFNNIEIGGYIKGV